MSIIGNMSNKLKGVLNLIRIKHWLKNLLVFVPLFFNGSLFDGTRLIATGLGFLGFSLMSSCIYIINDICDIEKDKNHPIKKYRPLASGVITKPAALIICETLELLSFVIVISIKKYSIIQVIGAYALYFLSNIIYSIYRGKDIPILDVSILSLGFVLRIVFGAGITGIKISPLLYLVTITGSMYLAFGKRRGELRQHSHNPTRTVLKYYTFDFLEKYMYISLTMMLILYALWCYEYYPINNRLIWSFPIVFIVFMRYSMITESENDYYESDPIEVIFKDKWLILISAIYLFYLLFVLYF